MESLSAKDDSFSKGSDVGKSGYASLAKEVQEHNLELKKEDIVSIKNTLENEDNENLLFKALTALNGIPITLKDLQETKIGKSVNKLTSHKERKVSDLADSLIKKWKKIAKAQKNDSDGKKPAERQAPIAQKPVAKVIEQPELEKKKYVYARSGDKNRDKTREMLIESLTTPAFESSFDASSISQNAVSIESELFKAYGSKMADYMRRARSIISNLKDPKNQHLIESILTGSLTPSTLATMDPKDMASESMKKQRAEVEQKQIEARRTDWNNEKNKDSIGMFKCFKCKSMKTSYFQMQTRSADEPMTTFVECMECGNHWKF